MGRSYSRSMPSTTKTFGALGILLEVGIHAVPSLGEDNQIVLSADDVAQITACGGDAQLGITRPDGSKTWTIKSVDCLG